MNAQLQTIDSVIQSCRVINCHKKHHARGLCPMHYRRFLITGTHEHKSSNTEKGMPLKWLINVVDNHTEECEIWPYQISVHGYGIISYRSKRVPAHRLALCLFSEKQYDYGLYATHGTCHNRACCNPMHLTWQDKKQNSIDRIRDGTMVRGEKHCRSKLTEDEVRSIRKDDGLHKNIAIKYGVTRGNVSSIKRGELWSWLK